MRWVLLAVLMGACGADRHLEVSDQEAPLNALRDDSWSTTGGSIGISPLGSNQFPAPLTIRLRMIEACGDNDECALDIENGSIEVAAGSPCNVTTSANCDGTKCFGEVQLTGLGNCMLRIHVDTTDGDDDATCWYRAVYEAADPFDHTALAMREAEVDRAVSDCRDDL